MQLRRRNVVAGLVLAGLGLAVGERIYLSALQADVLADRAAIDRVMDSLRTTSPAVSECHFMGSNLAYDWSWCVVSSSSPPGCPLGSLTLQYRGPMALTSLLSKDFHDREAMFRVSILNFDATGRVCYRYTH